MLSDKYRTKVSEIKKYLDGPDCDLQVGYNETVRLINITENIEGVLGDIDKQFSKETGITKKDIVFLFTAIGLQILRQYLVTKFPERLDDQTAARQTFGHVKEQSDRHHRLYNPSLAEIISNPVPFDANLGANGALSGAGAMGHRVSAIGHDPILGLFFGTANIATSTLTNCRLQSYHIYTNETNRDYFKCNARTELVITHTFDKMFNQGIEGKKLIAASLIKEIIHLSSDINTKNSLPLPFIPVVNARLASELASYGLDACNVASVGKQMTFSALIDYLIAMTHGLFYDESCDINLYKVRTSKILMYSNIVASSSNIAVAAITKDIHNLDLGGLIKSLYILLTNTEFIRQVNEKFMIDYYKNMIRGDCLFD